MRSFHRKAHDLRPISFEIGVQKDPAGSVLVAFGDTRVLCAVTIEEKIPPFLRGKGEGWITAEYAMLPGSSHDRIARDGMKGRPSGRSLEIGRLIGRALRAAVDRKALGERTLWIDCDVLQADGGTRTAAITGSWLALALALDHLRAKVALARDPLVEQIAAVSVGLGPRSVLVDLDYVEDSSGRADVNVVGAASGGLVEIQGTAEQGLIAPRELDRLLAAARGALSQLFELQQKALRQARASSARSRRSL